MQDSKFLQLFQTLSKSERRAFYTYMQQKFSKETAPFQLYEHFHKLGNRLTHAKAQMDYLQKHLFTKSVDTKRISNEASKIYRALEDFLLEQHLKKEEQTALRSLLLMDIFRERYANELVEKKHTAFQNAQSQQQTGLWKDLLDYQNNFARYYTEVDKTSPVAQEKLVKQTHSLDTFYLVHRLKNCCEWLSQAIILGKKVEPIDQQMKQLVELSISLNTSIPLFNYYQLAYQLIAFPNEENYTHFFQEVHPQQPFDPEDLRAGLFYLINYNAQLIRHDPQLGMKRCVELFQFGKENNWLVHHGYVSEATLHNAINVSCGLYKTDWAQRFLDDVYPLLEPNSQELAHQIAQARIDFALKKYEKVVADLAPLKFSDNYHIIQAKMLQLRSYFELKDRLEYEDALFYLKKSFRRYLKRNKIFSPATLASYLLFLELFEQLEPKEIDYDKIEKQLTSDTKIACKNWLVEKLKSYSPN